MDGAFGESLGGEMGDEERCGGGEPGIKELKKKKKKKKHPGSTFRDVARR